MPCRHALTLSLFAATVLLVTAGQAMAQTKVRTETVKPPAASAPSPPAPPRTSPNDDGVTGAVPGKNPVHRDAAVRPSDEPTALPEVITDLSQLPPQVARTRERILAAARTGDLKELAAVMRSNEIMPIFSLNNDKDPIGYWAANYPDSGGMEILSILTEILETGCVLADRGTPQESYIWPYFASMPLKSLTPPQRVELFRIVTGADYKDMLDFGAYNFYRLGIGPDGTWHFFVAGD